MWDRVCTQAALKFMDFSIFSTKVCELVATYLKLVRRESERVPKARRGWGRESTKGDMPPLVRGVRGISPEKYFDLWLPICAFWMRFGPEFQPSWADLEQAALAYS